MAAPAWKTAQELADGYLSLNLANLKRYQASELEALQREIDKVTREARAEIVPENDSDAAQAKNRKLLRLNQATVVLQSFRSKMSR